MPANVRSAARGEVWRVDFGIAGKVRPCLLLTSYPEDERELALITVIQHTTSLRGNSWEIEILKPFLQQGAFHMQTIQSVPATSGKFLDRLGSLTEEEMTRIEACLRRRLGLPYA